MILLRNKCRNNYWARFMNFHILISAIPVCNISAIVSSYCHIFHPTGQIYHRSEGHVCTIYRRGTSNFKCAVFCLWAINRRDQK